MYVYEQPKRCFLCAATEAQLTTIKRVTILVEGGFVTRPLCYECIEKIKKVTEPGMAAWLISRLISKESKFDLLIELRNLKDRYAV